MSLSDCSYELYNYSRCVLMVELIYVRFREWCYLWDFNNVMNITDGGSSRKPSNFLSLTVKHEGFEPKTGAVASGQDRVFLSINCLFPHGPLCAIWYLICYLFSLWLDYVGFFCSQKLRHCVPANPLTWDQLQLVKPWPRLATYTFGCPWWWLSVILTSQWAHEVCSIPLTLQQEHLFPVQITTDTPSSYPVLVFISPFSSPEVKNVRVIVWVTVVVVPRDWDFPGNSLIPQMPVFAISFPVS